MYLESVDAIASDFISKLPKEEKAQGKKMTKEEMRGLHFFLGMQIRNTYGLWKEDNPLTKQWFDDHKAGNKEHIKDGVDYHPKHPDQVSDEVLVRIWEKLQEE